MKKFFAILLILCIIGGVLIYFFKDNFNGFWDKDSDLPSTSSSNNLTPNIKPDNTPTTNSSQNADTQGSTPTDPSPSDPSPSDPSPSDPDPDIEKTYTITFRQNGFADIVKTVKHGHSLTDIPSPQSVDGFTVIWDDTSFNYVTRDIIVNAIFIPGDCKITEMKDGFLLDESGTVPKISLTVPSNIRNLDLSNAFVVSPGCTWKLFSDFGGGNELELKGMELDYGTNIAYLVVFHPDNEHFTRYEIEVCRLDAFSYSFIADEITVSLGMADVGTKINSCTAPEKAGYTFEGWMINDNIVSFPYIINESVTFVAKYTPTVFTIEYKLNGGDDVENPSSYTILQDVVLEAPTRSYYTFSGWYESEDLDGSVITKFNAGTYGNKTLYAKWTPIDYDITYILGKDTNNSSNPKTYNTEQNITLNTPNKVGYTFLGWYNNSSFRGDKITSIEAGSHGSKIFYAKWTPTVYKIDYSLDKGENNPLNPTEYNIEQSFSLRNPTKLGYIFKGWYTDKDFLNEVTEIPLGETENKTLYAKWEVIKYSITYVKNGGTESLKNPTSFTVEDLPIKLNDLNSKTDYLFNYWYDRSDFKGEPIMEINELKSFTLYAEYINCTTGVELTELGSVWTVSGYEGSGRDVILPSIYKGKSITSISDNAFYECTSIASVKIPHSVTSIGIYSFYNCTSLLSVDIGDNVESIGGSAFRSCTSLASITVPNSVKFIGTYAFYDCTSLRSITLGNGISSIGNYAFYNCTRLTSIIIPKGVTSIGSFAFEGCTRLVIYCEAEEQPSGWHSKWNSSNRPVRWGH